MIIGGCRLRYDAPIVFLAMIDSIPCSLLCQERNPGGRRRCILACVLSSYALPGAIAVFMDWIVGPLFTDGVVAITRESSPSLTMIGSAKRLVAPLLLLVLLVLAEIEGALGVIPNALTPERGDRPVTARREMDGVENLMLVYTI